MLPEGLFWWESKSISSAAKTEQVLATYGTAQVVPCTENRPSRRGGLWFPISGAKSAPDMGHPGLVEGLNP